MLSWLSVDTWLITALSVAYLFGLFVVAYWGQNQSSKHWTSRPWVYSLSLGVSCTSWAFYGTVGQAAVTGAWLAPIYIGSIATLVLAWPMLLKTLQIIKQQNLTSIADFIAFRYDRSATVAAAVAIVVLIGIIPYVALQLRAISVSFDLLTGTYQSGISTAFVVTLVLIAFSIFFGTRKIAANKQNQGLVLAMAASSIVKLFALTAVGIFATFYVFNGFGDLLSQRESVEFSGGGSAYLSFAQALLGAITIFILPQQFHMMMIENHHQSELKTARWLFPVYLLLINVFVLPIAIAGQLSFPGGSVDPDIYVLTLPLFYQQAWLGIVVYIGGLAAATSMVIVSAIVLSLMLSTEIITPMMLKLRRFSSEQAPQMSGLLLNLRRCAIAVILLLAFAFERLIAQQNHLASIGLLSFVLLSQFAPATLGALYWRDGTGKGALSGLIVGSFVWFYTLLIPAIFTDAVWLKTGPLSIMWLKPDALFGITMGDAVSHGVFFSLAANLLCYVIVSLLSHRSVGEKLQAELYVNKTQAQYDRHLTVADLTNLLIRFTDPQNAKHLTALVAQHPSDKDLSQAIEYTRLTLSGVLGSASTRMVMRAASTSQQMPLEDVVSIVDEASQMFRFNRELLQSGVENIEQGMSVVNADMQLVAWNQRYIQLLDYPLDLVVAGTPIATLIEFNIGRGLITGSEEKHLVARRLEHMLLGHSHHFQRIMPNGLVLEIRGQPMPGGGFVSTFYDISAHINNEKALKLANETLELRVLERTKALEQAVAQAKAANSSKTRFLAAASHDLMQPFNALSLFTSMLKTKVNTNELSELANHIDDSLNVVESLLSDLVEISTLDGGSHKPTLGVFALDELLTPLQNEFRLLAKEVDIKFSYQETGVFVNSDKALLRRILQNFLSNAVHYCRDQRAIDNDIDSKIVLGVRRRNNNIRLEVWDNGPGIAADKQQQIFEEFERLEQNRDVPGLGLGLAISERIAGLLGLSISLKSTTAHGTCFSIEVPRVDAATYPTAQINPLNEGSAPTLSEQCILVIDNDELSLIAMVALLNEWGCYVVGAKNKHQAITALGAAKRMPQLIISDYHLDDGCNGVDTVKQLLAHYQLNIECVICSADSGEAVREHTSSAQFLFLRKPVKGLALKRTLRNVFNRA